MPKPYNCLDFQCDDGIDSGETKPQCLVTGLVTFARATILPALLPVPTERFHVRSITHFDMTWVLGRMAGLSEADATQLALYSEAADLGVYQHYDHQGKRMEGLDTLDISGGVRTNIPTLGYGLHFLPWYRGALSMKAAPMPKYHQSKPGKSPWAKHEHMLSHMRAWAFGQRDSLCELGLTKDMSKPDADCFAESDNRQVIVYDPLIPGPTNTSEGSGQETEAILQWQRMQPLETLPQSCTDDPTAHVCYNPDYATNNHGSVAALGIYVHGMTDRISHHYCASQAGIEQLSGEAADYRLIYPSQCGPVGDIVNHNQELANVAMPERTYLGIEYTLREIRAWVAATHYRPKAKVKANPNFPALDDMQGLLRMFGNALSQDDAAERIQSMCEIAVRGYNLGWHDGNPTCNYTAGEK